MPLRKRATRVNAQNIRTYLANQRVQRNQDDIEVPPPPTDLNPEDFSSRVHITPAITEFHDADDADDSQSSDFSEIEEESELKRFTQALQKAQIIALKKENENKTKRRVYSKQSKRTLKRRAQQEAKMRSKGFLPLNEFFKLKSKKEDSNNTDALTPELDDTTKALREESEEGSDELEEIAPKQDTSQCPAPSQTLCMHGI
ncbi:hypothetical protein BGY98DRAFT_931577 [Russula aff. rugulosa BPL654]|nr:hypothetical protein BGY98DRAFT_931577 [Russula aff. rugulosa BPL654]